MTELRRREALKWIGLMFAGLASALTDLGWTRTFGYLTPDICVARGLNPAHARVFLNGVLVTSTKADASPREHVMACDDRAGFIEMLARNDAGAYYTDWETGKLARRRRYGRVRVVFEETQS